MVEKKSNKIYSKTKLNCAYYLHIQEKKIKVCKAFFKATLDISNCAIDTVLKKRDDHGFISTEQRGKRTDRVNKMDNALTQELIDHINKKTKKEELERHKKETELSRQEENRDKETAMENEKLLVYSFDLQTVIPLPNSNVSTCQKKKVSVTCHTENEGDSMHSCYEKEKNRILKKNPIYVPSEIYAVTKLAKKKTGNPYTVIETSTEEFVDWKKVCGTMGKNFVINEMNEREKKQQNKMYYKTSYEEEEYKVVDSRRKTRGKRSEIKLVPLYKEPPAIPIKK
ncbi:hypothetical protein ILUMI_08073 [Ignelater luminosus]|uniref:Uncharacterized protein n=1 Tax=Ignelater luminosus TaxID=2038154 RepID=A0A8K0D885_IGNLU|nr:hypothetical protein ILUMI_08073 [Ignelater luminosus]